MSSQFHALDRVDLLAEWLARSILSGTWRVSLLTLFVAAASFVLRHRMSAACKHALWLAVLAIGLILPVASLAFPSIQLLPHWTRLAGLGGFANGVIAAQTDGRFADHRASTLNHPLHSERETSATRPIDPQRTDAAATVVDRGRTSMDSTRATARSSISTSPGSPWTLDARWIAAVWVAGFLTFCAPLVRSLLSLSNVARRTPRATDPRWTASVKRASDELNLVPPTVLLGPAGAMPMVWGLVRGWLLLPADALSWSDARLRAVVLHELAHLARRDPWALIVCQLSRAVHWFNPLIWGALWRAMIEQERASDDYVLRADMRASDYAEWLLDLAADRRRVGCPASLALAMSQRTRIERRLAAILDESRSRVVVARWLARLIAVAAVAIAIPLALLQAADEAAFQPPQAAHVSTSDHSAYCVHDGSTAQLVFLYKGSFNSSTYSSHNARNRTWRDAGTLTLENGQTFDFERTHQAPDSLTINGDTNDLDKGRVFLLAADGGAKQVSVQPPIVTGQNLMALVEEVNRQMDQDAAAASKPRHQTAEDLLVRWRAGLNADGKLPGALLARLARHVEQFIKQYPDDPAAKTLAAILPTIDAERDWSLPEVTDLLNRIGDANTAPIGWTELQETFAAMNRVKSGENWPAEKLAGLKFGPPADNGLRVAWALDPEKEAYAIGEIVKTRVVFHNAGNQAVQFVTHTWHQDDRWNVRDDQGNEIETKSVWYSGITPHQRYRLEPGQAIEVAGHGVGIGTSDYAEAYSLGKIGKEIHAKAGDTVVIKWEVIGPGFTATDGEGQQQVPGPQDWTGTLSTGEVRFRVVAVDDNVPAPPGMATGPGRYTIGPRTKLQVSRTTHPNGAITNTATILFYDADTQPSPVANSDRPAHEWPLEMPTGLDSFVVLWQRNGNAIWIGQEHAVRKLTILGPSDVSEEHWKYGEPGDFGGMPVELREELNRRYAAAAQSAPSDAARAAPLTAVDLSHWGNTSPRGIQLGFTVEPRKPVYRLGERVILTIQLYNTTGQSVETTMPRLEILEKLGLDLVVQDDAGQKLPWRWGRAHQSREELTVSGAIAAAIPAHGSLDVARMTLTLGEDRQSNDVLAFLELQPGQRCRLGCKINSYSYARDEGEPLESAMFELAIAP